MSDVSYYWSRPWVDGTPWSEREDRFLRHAVETRGADSLGSILTHTARMLGRTVGAVTQRWYRVLKPGAKIAPSRNYVER